MKSSSDYEILPPSFTLFENIKIGEGGIKASISARNSNLTINFCDFMGVNVNSSSFIEISFGNLFLSNCSIRNSRISTVINSVKAAVTITNLLIKKVELESGLLTFNNGISLDITNSTLSDINYFGLEAGSNFGFGILLFVSNAEYFNNSLFKMKNTVFSNITLASNISNNKFYHVLKMNILIEFCSFSNLSTNVLEEYNYYEDDSYNFLFSQTGNVSFLNCLFSQFYVFALVSAQNSKMVSINTCHFIEISAQEYFNFFFNYGFKIESSKFINLLLIDYFVFMQNGTLIELSNASFLDNFYKNVDGFYQMGLLFIYEANGSYILIEKCLFRNISLLERSLLLFSADDRLINITLDINSTCFEQISTSKSGSLLDFSGVAGVGSLWLFNITVNSSVLENSIIKIEKAILFSLLSCNFSQIDVKDYSGGVIYSNYNNIILVENSTFASIILDKFPKNMEIAGGFLYAQQKNDITIKFCAFTMIKASNEAAIFYLMKNNILLLYSSNYSHNEVIDGTGSCIFAMSSNTVEFFGNLTIVNKNASIYFLRFLTNNNLIFREESRAVLIREVPDTIFFVEGEANNITMKKITINFYYSDKITFLFAAARNYIQATDINMFCYKSNLRVFYSMESNVFELVNFRIIYEDSSLTFLDDRLNSSLALDDIKFKGNKKNSNENSSVSTHEDSHPKFLFYIKNPAKVSLNQVHAVNFTLTGLIYISNCSQSVVITNSYFISNTGILEESLISIIGSKFVLFKNNQLRNNDGFINGSVSINLNKYRVFVYNNTFTGNKAVSEQNLSRTKFSRGGGLNINSENILEIGELLEMAENRFYNNYADYGGGLYVDVSWIDGDYELVFKKNNIYSENDAIIGNDVASRIKNFYIYKNDTHENRVLDPKEDLFVINGEDHFKNTYQVLDFLVEIEDVNNNYFFNVTSKKLNLFANFINLKNIYDTYKNEKNEDVLKIEFTANLTIKYKEVISHSNQSILRFYQCPSGHYFDNLKFSCISCSENTLKLKRNVDKYCDSCDKNKVSFCYGGNNLSLRGGFYRKGNSSQILRCKNIYACNNSKCNPTYKEDGFLCSVCIEKYGMTSDWECIECSNPVSHLFLALSLLFQFFLKAYSVKKAYKLTKNLKRHDEKGPSKATNYTIFDLASTNSCLKIMNIHLAFTFSLLSYPFRAIDQLGDKATPVWVSWTDPFKYSYQCLYSDLGIPYHGVYSRMHMRILIPVIIVVLWFIYYGYKIYKKDKVKAVKSNVLANRTNFTFYNRKYDQKKFYKTLIIELMKSHSLEAVILIALYISYEDMIYGFGFIIFFFKSKEDEGDINRMLHEPVRDWNSYPNEVYMPITLLLIIFFGLLIPVYIILRLRFTKQKFQNQEEKNLEGDPTKLENFRLFSKYGYFYYPYNKNYYYFEIFYMLKRVVYITYNIFIIPLISIHTKYETNLVMFINLEIIFLWIFFLIHSYVRPYRRELSKVNSLETRSSTILLTSFFFSALFFNDVDSENLKDGFQIRVNMALYLSIYIINTLYLINLLIIIYKNEKYNIKIFIKSKLIGIAISILKMIIRRICRHRGKHPSKNKTDSLRKIEELDLNPLAIWEAESYSRSLTAPRYKRRSVWEKKIKTYKNKIEVLTLLVKMQKKELKKLNGILKNNGNSIYNSGEMEENSKLKINSMQVGRIHKPEPTINHQSTVLAPNKYPFHFDLNNIPDDNEEIVPNKIKLQDNNNLNMFLNFEIKERACLEEIQRPDEKHREPEGKDKVEENITATQIIKLIGTGCEDYFLKIKVLMKNSLENIENLCFKFNNTEDVFLKLRRKDAVPEYWLKDEALKLTFYLKLLGDSIPKELHLVLDLKSHNSTYKRTIHIHLSEIDFVKISKFYRDFFPGRSFLGKKKEFNYVPFEHKVEKKIVSSTQNKGAIDSFGYLRVYFPELFDNEGDNAEEKRDHGSSKNYFRQGLFVNNSREGKEILEIQESKEIPGIQKSNLLNTIDEADTQRIKKKSAKVDLLLWGAYLYLDIEEQGSLLTFNFRDLYCRVEKGENNTFISHQLIVELLNKFLSSRDLFEAER